ncbi:MAG: recombinase family protein [Verrucomicrobiota bacterium]
MNDSEAETAMGGAAAAYVRMSTEHQQYSLDNQMDVIRAYAGLNGLKIVKVYSDGGKSGLSIQGRDALSGMIEDVRANVCAFQAILVYDISRWGRFQDADEGAYYEYLCKRAGLAVHYCAEQFNNDGTPVSAIMKSIKRTMAGEYSRELSAKVFQGACRLIQLGYKQGGAAGFGLRRLLVDQHGMPKTVMKTGEQKSLQTDRVILIAGPEEERQIVIGMYASFAQHRKTETEIANDLNARGIQTDLGRAWTRATVHQVLTNEKYIGNNVYFRTSFKLKRHHVTNTPDQWVRAKGAFQALVEPDVFEAARQIILARSIRLSDSDMLGKLRDILQHNGQLSGILIDEREDCPSSSAYRHRFGSLLTAYRLIGYSAGIDYSFIEINRRLRERHPELVESVIREISARGGEITQGARPGLLHVNDEVFISVVLCRHDSTPAGSSRWVIRFDTGNRPDITIAVRMDATNEGVLDYYILPAIDMTWQTLRVAEDNGVYLDAYRFETLEPFMTMISRTPISIYEN